jgi:peptidylprolyl isomerase/peptidyl-prolyl cis-trans isomerase B (cyclophilin B)
VTAAAPATAASSGPVDLTVDPASGLSKATVTMATTEGVIKFKFYTKDAPVTTNRLVELISKGFYNGLSFHRVVPGFVVQGGDPSGNGTGGSGVHLKAEFNDRHHLEGTVAMARAQDPDSADSQFYICLGTLPSLDHQYTVVGQVVDGMDVVRKIHVGDKMTSVVVK